MEASLQPDGELAKYVMRLGDDRLVNGHRLSEWCGHAPILEEDIALANIALDNLGQASLLLELSGKLEGKNRTADDLAYFRDSLEFRNLKILELPRGDFAFTIVRQFLFDAFSYHLYNSLARSTFEPLAAIAQKASKEISYHLRHSGEWLIRLADGTAESRARVDRALEELWPYTSEFFLADEVDTTLAGRGVAPDLTPLKGSWEKTVAEVFMEATLESPALKTRTFRPGRLDHTEHLGRMLAEMQIVARSYPGASW